MSNTTFSFAASVTFQVPAGGNECVVALPAVDANNPDLLIQNNTGSTAYISIGGGRAGLSVPGSFAIGSGQNALVTDKGQDAATLATVVGSPGAVVFTRGTSTTPFVPDSGI